MDLVRKDLGSTTDDAGRVFRGAIGTSIINCGDILITPFNAVHAFGQWNRMIGKSRFAKCRKDLYGPICVTYLGSQPDTRYPFGDYNYIASDQSGTTHGTFFWHAVRESCINKGHKCARLENKALRTVG